MTGFYGAILVLGFGWLLINLVTYVVFAADKRFAEIRAWRIPEATLLSLALFGGSIGAKLAQKRVRHKTRKQPFAFLLNLIVAAHVGVILSMTYAGLWVPLLEMSGGQLEALFTLTNSWGGGAFQPKRFGPGA